MLCRETRRPQFPNETHPWWHESFWSPCGYTYIHGVDGDPRHDSHDLPDMLLRYGLAERLELRIAWDEGVVFDRTVNRNTGRVNEETGLTDAVFGFKYAINKQEQWFPESSIILIITTAA